MFGKRLHDFSVEEYGNGKERNCLWIGLVEGTVAFPIWEQEAVDTDQGTGDMEQEKISHGSSWSDIPSAASSGGINGLLNSWNQLFFKILI